MSQLSLHQLLVRPKINYEVSTLCYSFSSYSSPAYISDLLTIYVSSKQLRFSTGTRNLKVPSPEMRYFVQRSSLLAQQSRTQFPLCSAASRPHSLSHKKSLKRQLFNHLHHHHHLLLSLNREGHWGTTDDFATSLEYVCITAQLN